MLEKMKTQSVTPEDVHKMLQNGSDEQKLEIAINCQLRGIDIKKAEELCAIALNCAGAALKPAMETYNYLSHDYRRNTNEIHN